MTDVAADRVVHLLVPSPDRSRLLARPNGLAGWQLPAIATTATVAWERDADQAAARLLGARVAPVRRFGASAWEVEAIDRIPRAGTTWIGADESARLGVHASLAQECLGAEPSPVAHLRPGWRSEIEAWAGEHAPLRGSVELRRHWELGGVLRAATELGYDVAIKQAGPGFEREAPVTAILDGLEGAPHTIAADGLRLLTAWAGEPATHQHRAAAAECLGRLHRSAIDRLPALRAAGVHDLAHELPAEITPALGRALDEVAGLGLDSTVVHGDAHLGNVMVAGLAVTFIDWSDPYIGSPALDLIGVVGHGTDPATDAARAVVHAWARAFGCDAEPVISALSSVRRVALSRCAEVAARLGATQPSSAAPFWAEERGFFLDRLAALDRAAG